MKFLAFFNGSIANSCLKPHRTDKTVFSGIYRFAAQVFFDAQQLIIFFNPFTPAGCAGLQMAGIQGHRHIGDKAVDGLAAAVGDTCAPAGLPAHLNGFNGLRQRPDLVEFDQDRIGGLFLNAPFNVLDVGDKKVVSDEFNTVSQALIEGLPTAPQSSSASPPSREQIG